jgi:hypothetical protein
MHNDGKLGSLKHTSALDHARAEPGLHAFRTSIDAVSLGHRILRANNFQGDMRPSAPPIVLWPLRLQLNLMTPAGFAANACF